MIKHTEFLRRHDDGRGGGETESYDPTKLLDMRQLDTTEFESEDLDLIHAFTAVYNRIVEDFDLSAHYKQYDYRDFPPELKLLCIEAAKHRLITVLVSEVPDALYAMHKDRLSAHPRKIINSVLQQLSRKTHDQYEESRQQMISKFYELVENDGLDADGNKNVVRSYFTTFNLTMNDVVGKFISMTDRHINQFVMESLIAHLLHQLISSRKRGEVSQ